MLECVQWVHNMETVKVGIREFRENLAGYLESGTPLAIMRHGQTLGYYIPAQKRSRKAELEAMRAAAKDLDQMIASWGASEDELVEEFKADPAGCPREAAECQVRRWLLTLIILVRAVLGKRVRDVIETYCEEVTFFVPEAAYAEAEEHLPRLVTKRGGDPEKALAFLHALKHSFQFF